MQNELVSFLERELSQRVEKNPRYSMRAFAKYLGLNIGSLSGILSGKRNVTPKSAKKICDKLGLSPAQRAEIVMATLVPAGSPAKTLSRIELQEEMFRIVSDWYHWAILQLVRTEKYLCAAQNSNPKWVAKQLRISEIEAKLALERLVKLKLLKKNHRGFFERSELSFATADKSRTSIALKKWQKQVREKSLHSLENDPIELRSHTLLRPNRITSGYIEAGSRHPRQSNRQAQPTTTL